ncbi:UNVERIFIED_CONTAM: Aspartic proteinase CDR1 [Sesamum calycinum]|uniref:Aspartic proteinase CDR1 n=1 Tax=Sesamum calycinum TaxID=2727403 RepID=A0AAW2NTC4_9LAMI
MSSERVTNALRRSFNRVNVLTQDYARLPSTDVFSDKGEYLMKFSIGTPPVETLAIADTGSDLTWIRCNRPSSLCLHQKAPLFEPTHSSTYKPISCTSSPCNSLLGSAFCDGFKGICRYTAEYGDGSFSNGDLATETMKLGTVTIPNVTIGCGYHDKSSFGASASGSLPFYAFTTEWYRATWRGKHHHRLRDNIDISPRELYNKVIAEVKSQMKLREIDDPQGLLSLCYLSIENAAQVPEITVHFKGADLKLKYVNVFVKTSKSALCLAFAPASSVAIYGNLAQMDFLVGYDLEKRTVSFKPTDCSKT